MRYLSAILLLLAAALLTGAPLAAQPALTGPEIFVDTSEPKLYYRPAAAVDGTGNLLVVWVGSQGEVRGRAFDASGRPVRPAFTLFTGNAGEVTLAPAAPDGFLLAWNAYEETRQGGRHRLLARRLSPTGRLRGAVIQVRSPILATEARAIESIQAASAPDGSFTVVWSEKYPRDVFFRSFDAAGRPLAAAASVPGEGGNDERYAPAVVVLDNGEIRIGWSTESIAGSNSLWIRRFSRSGAPLAAPVQLMPPNANAWSALVTFSPQGGYLATWVGLGDPVGSGGHRRVRTFAPDGRPFSEHEVESGLDQVTAARDGTFLLYSSVCGLLLEADGTPRGQLGCLINPSAVNVHQAVFAGTADGGFALFWSQSFSGQSSEDLLHGQFLATAGPGTLQIERARFVILENAFPPLLTLRILRRDGTDGTVSVDYRLTGAASGGGTVTFPDGDSAPRTISIPVADDDIPGNDRSVRVALSQPTGGAVLGAPRRAVVEIRDDDQPSPLLARAEPLGDVAGDANTDLSVPGLAATPTGEFAVAWAYAYYGASHYPLGCGMRGQLFDAAGQPAATHFDLACSQPVERVTLAIHPEGDFMVLWQEETWKSDAGALSLIGFAQRFDARGAAAGRAVSLGFLPDSAAPLPKARFVAVGRHATGEGLFAHFLSTNGLDRRSPVLITSDALQRGSLPAVATDASGRSVVVWAVAPTGVGPAGIFARRFNALGAPLGGAFRVSQWEGQDVAPSVATDRLGNFVVAWQRSWDGSGSGIYARGFNAEGAPLGDEIAVNSETEGDQRAPSVALTGDGRFAVLWQSYGVSGQLFAGPGTRLGSEAQVDPHPRPGMPTIVWSERGFFVVIISSSGNFSENRTYGYIHASRFPL
jgi:hypothetical protein